jgi:hypothetical protein
MNTEYLSKSFSNNNWSRSKESIQFSDKYYKLFERKKLDSQQIEFDEFVECVLNNSYLALKFLEKTSDYGKEIFHLVEIGDHKTLWDFVLLSSSEFGPLHYLSCMNILKKFPQRKLDIFRKLCHCPANIFKEEYEIFLDAISDEDLECFIDEFIEIGSYKEKYFDSSSHILHFLLNKKTNYPLIKVIYKLMYYKNNSFLKNFIEWTKSPDCTIDVDVQFIRPYHEDHDILGSFEFFTENYYDYSEYYCEFEIQDKDICWFTNVETLEKFLELCQYGFLVVPREKIINDFIHHAHFASYNKFQKMMYTYEKKGVSIDFFNPNYEEKIIETLVNDTGSTTYDKITFFERYYGIIFEPAGLKKFDCAKILSIPFISLLKEYLK